MVSKFFFSKGGRKRLAVFSISVCCVIVLCITLGYFGGIRTDRIISRMIENGQLTARGWRIVSFDAKNMVVTRYNRTIHFKGTASDAYQIGDYVSFKAQKDAATGIWIPVTFHVHGKSVVKFLVSVVALVIAGAMGLRYIRFDRQSRSLTFQSRK